MSHRKYNGSEVSSVNMRTKMRILRIGTIVLVLASLVTALAFPQVLEDPIALFFWLLPFIVYVILYCVWWRCPHCGRMLGRTLFFTEFCRFCGKPLTDDE